jgi:phospholipase D1/2
MIIEENVEEEEQEKGGSASVAAKVENGHLPADASLASKTYGQPSHVRMGKNDNDVDGQKAQRARHLMRKYPNVNLGQPLRAVPTQKPKFDADSFEDPLCDEFWEDVWIASAVHNVSVYRQTLWH